ncbi:MAG: metal ABC transporter permease [Myxococcales bacterium]|nr:metal ABC transporter permease [Myxococcales bacterium]
MNCAAAARWASWSWAIILACWPVLPPTPFLSTRTRRRLPQVPSAKSSVVRHLSNALVAASPTPWGQPMPLEQPPTLQDFFASWDLFADPALAGALAGAVLGALGVYVVVRRMVFLSAALAQAAGFGVAAAWFAQIHLGVPAAWATPTVGAGLSSTLAAVLMTGGDAGLKGRRDGWLGGVYLIGAAGTLALGTRIVQEVQDIETILFGSAVAVSPEDLRSLAWMVGIIGVIHVIGLRGFVQVAVDENGARVRGLPVRLLGLLLMGSLALSVSLGTRILGALPVFALTVLPPLAALRLAPNVGYAVLLATLIGASAGFLGYISAFLWKLPVGAAQTLCAAVLLAIAFLAGKILEFLHNRSAHRHGHIHGAGCGHVAIRHGDHVDYLDDGQLQHSSNDGHEIHGLASHTHTGNGQACHTDALNLPSQAQPHGHGHSHVHGAGCGHPRIAHGDHADFLVAGRLHHQHGDHCDDHGPVDIVD